MNTDIFLDDIRSLPDGLGLMEQTDNIEPSSPLMAGRFNYHTFGNGLSTHTTDAIEQQNSNNRLELLPGLSFNFIFKGVIDYSFAAQRYRLEPLLGQPLCSAIINNGNEVMTRHMTAGMHIQKVNIYVECHWLEQRCESKQDLSFLQQLFNHKQVQTWLPEADTLQKAQQLLHHHLLPTTLSNKLAAEQMTIALLANCLQELQQHQATVPSHSVAHTTSTPDLKRRIDKLLSKCRSLSEIADNLNMSERTLQRKFKQLYQQTASHYVKQKRLDEAKRALIVDKRSIGEVAYQAGYNHSSNFVNAFKRAFGLTPSEFVAKHTRSLR